MLADSGQGEKLMKNRKIEYDDRHLPDFVRSRLRETRSEYLLRILSWPVGEEEISPSDFTLYELPHADRGAIASYWHRVGRYLYSAMDELDEKMKADSCLKKKDRM